jgi:hypothetical protein
MSHYTVPIVRRELWPLWRDYNDSYKPSDRVLAAGEDGALGQAVSVRASNMLEAARLAESKNPGYIAISSAIEMRR